MWIQFNDKSIQCTENITVQGLLEHLQQFHPGLGIALSINQQILPRKQWSVRQVQEGDHILLFQVIAGG